MPARKKKAKPTKKKKLAKKVKKSAAKKYVPRPPRTEFELTVELSEDLRDAWDRLRETLLGFGEQNQHTSHWAIMFNRARCFVFVRPKKKYLETVFFLSKKLKSPMLKQVTSDSKTRYGHVIRIIHRDQIEAPLTDWLHRAYLEAPALQPALTPLNDSRLVDKAG